MKNYNKR